MSIHKSVLLQEIIRISNPTSGRLIVDSTFGGGGYSVQLAQMGATVLSIDKDPDAIREGEKYLSEIACLNTESSNSGFPTFSFPDRGQIILAHETFRNLSVIFARLFPNQLADVVLFDLGLSSDQIASGRGFSFQQADKPLDMRFDPVNQQVQASDLLSALSEKEITYILKNYGDEKKAKQIAQKIVDYRRERPIKLTSDLVNIISEVYPTRGRIHPATKTFQALRIAVNSEFDELEQGLENAWQITKTNGDIVTISFHSGEDRIVKNFAKSKNLKLSNPIYPSQIEVNQNPRARSAILRIITKI